MNIEQAVKHGKHWLAAGWVWDAGQVALVYTSGRWETWSVPGSDIGSWPLWTRGLSMVPDMRNRGTLGHALGQVQDAWGDESISVFAVCTGRHSGVWTCEWHVDSALAASGGHHASRWGNRPIRRADKAEALLAARRAAP